MNMRPSEIRRMVVELIEKGCTVDIYPDGAMKFAPPTAAPKPIDADLVDWSKK